MDKRLHRWTAVSTAVAALFLAAAAAQPVRAEEEQALDGSEASLDKAQQKVVKLKDARLKIELNATDRDAGVQVFIDAEPWKTMNIYDPKGRLIFGTTTRGVFRKQGGTELFMESGEPNFDTVSFEAFLKRFPEGKYRITGQGVAGETYVGTAKLTHDVPDGPVLVSPLNSVVDPDSAVVRWQPVAAPNGSPIIGYQVLVVRPDTGIVALPKIVLDVMMPPTATSMAVPRGFLQPNADYEWEVLAIEKGGNQTLSSSTFKTSQ